MKNKEVAKILLENPDDDFVISIDPNFSDVGTRVFATRIVEVLKNGKETIICMDGKLNT